MTPAFRDFTGDQKVKRRAFTGGTGDQEFCVKDLSIQTTNQISKKRLPPDLLPLL
jgi:hypothetical protein